MINMTIVENALSGLDEAGCQNAVHASLAWSQAVRLANLELRSIRCCVKTDPMYIRDASRREAFIKGLEEQKELSGQLLSYFGRCTTSEIAPTGKAIVELLGSESQIKMESDLSEAEFAKMMGISSSEAAKAYEQANVSRAEDEKHARLTVESSGDDIQRLVDGYLKSLATPPEEIPEIAATSILNKAADKVYAAMERTISEAARVRRPTRVAKLGARKRIMESIMNRIDEALDRIEEGEADGRVGGKEPSPDNDSRVYEDEKMTDLHNTIEEDIDFD